MLKSEYDSFLDADIIFPTEPFEVDGITYTPPWLNEDSVPSVNYQPMIDLKEDHYWVDAEGYVVF